MTPTEIIEIVDRITPNAHATADKLRWLGQLDTQIRTEAALLLRVPPEQVNGLLCASSVGAPGQLLVGEPWAEELYGSYLRACMAWADEEDQRYDRFITRFNDAYRRLMSCVIQTCRPAGARYLRF